MDGFAVTVIPLQGFLETTLYIGFTDGEMAEEWLRWVRNSVGYKNSGLTSAHYDKMARGEGKEILQFLQRHIRTEEETRMIKENISLYFDLGNGSGTSGDVSSGRRVEDVQSLENELSQTSTEIRILEDKIKKLEASMGAKASQNSKTQAELRDLQRRDTLLRGIYQQDKDTFDEFNRCGGDLEKFLNDYLSKTGGGSLMGEKSTVRGPPARCPGCMNGENVRKTFLCALEEAKALLSADAPRKNALIDFDATRIVTEHNSECLLGIFTELLARAELGSLDDHASLKYECDQRGGDPIQVLQRKVVDTVKEVAAIRDARNKLERDEEEMKRKEFEALQNDHQIAIIRDNLDTQLRKDGLRGAFDWIENMNGENGANTCTKRALETEILRLTTARKDLEKKHSELASLEEERECALTLVSTSLHRVSDAKQEGQAVLRDLVENFKGLISVVHRYNRSGENIDRFRTLLNGVKVADMFQSVRSVSKDASALADLFVPGPSAETACCSGNFRGILTEAMLKELWESIRDSLGSTQWLMTEVKNKATVRDNTIAELMSKLSGSGEEVTQEWREQAERIRDALTEWSMQEAENSTH